MQDLSHLAADSLWITNQHSGNRPSDNSGAMTAPGTPSPSVDEADVVRQPIVQPAADDSRETVTGRASGRARPVLRLGQWNELP